MLRGVLLVIRQHVVPSAPNFGRRAQRTRVVAMSDHAPTPAHEPVHSAGDAYPEAAHGRR